MSAHAVERRSRVVSTDCFGVIKSLTACAWAMTACHDGRPPVQFEVTEQTRESLAAWIRSSCRRPEDYLFPSRLHASPR